MMHAHYKTKKELKSQVGKQLNYSETSMFGNEYSPNGTFCVTNVKRSWFAQVTVQNDIIVKVK
jgi:hypothetical protein